MSTDPGVTAFADETVQRATSLIRDAFALYESSHNIAAAAKYEQAARAAEVIGRADIEATARFWQAVCLHCAGRLTEALAALTPIAAGRLQSRNHDRPIHMGITRYVLIAIDLPLRLDLIERAIHEAERIEGHTGRQRRTRLLLARARLAALRGQFADAIRFALEGLERSAVETDGYAKGAYYREATRACLRLGDTAQARRLIGGWLEVRDQYVLSRRVMVAAHRSIADRLDGDIDGAVAEARAAVDLAAGSEDILDRLYSADALARALLCTSDTSAARAPLALFIRHRSAEIGLHRVMARLLHADHLHALARRTGGLPALDPESGRCYPAVAVRADRALASKQLRIARRAYAAAARAGADLDRLHRCTTRAEQLVERLALVESTERQVS